MESRKTQINYSSEPYENYCLSISEIGWINSRIWLLSGSSYFIIQYDILFILYGHHCELLNIMRIK